MSVAKFLLIIEEEVVPLMVRSLFIRLIIGERQANNLQL